jgi:membrane protein required for colicin V production
LEAQAVEILDLALAAAGSMKTVDIVLILFLTLLTALGLWSGLVWQLYRIVSIVLAIFLSARFAQPIADAMGTAVIESERWRLFIAYIVVFILVVIACYLVGRLLKNLINKAKLGSLDIVLGGLFGLLKGALIAGVILCGVIRYFPEDSGPVQAVHEATFAPPLVNATRTLWGILPEDFRQDVAGKMDAAEAGARDKASETIRDEVDRRVRGEPAEE